jgi:hypothetical protein
MEKTNPIKEKLKYKSSHLDCKVCTKLTGEQNLTEKFLELSCDDESENFINNCYKSRYQLFKASYLRPWITYFYSLPEANAMLGTGKMFMFSKSHLNLLFDNQTFNNMLDIGAGDGNVTNQFRIIVLTGDITCIESSKKMIKVLQKNGYKIQNEIEGNFELVACLNVLDRCDRPITMLENIKKINKKYAIISIVLPFRGFYYNGVKKSEQLEHLIDYYKHWEENVNILCKKFNELGFKIIKVSRLPYLSEGDNKKEMYSLDTAVFILE